MIQETDSKQLKLPDRKEITLCEAVTAFIHGEASDALWLGLDLDLAKLTEADTVKVEDILGQLHSAAHAGRVKFCGLKNGENRLDGHKAINSLYFGRTRGFDWRHDRIWDQDLSDPASTKDWWDVHLDREQFEALLRDMAVSIRQCPDADVPGERKTYKTGEAGRPTSKHLVQPMALSRLKAGDHPSTLAQFSKELAEALAVAEPLAAPMKPKTVANAIRKLWHERQDVPKIIDPS